jgi:hypothetical protein
MAASFQRGVRSILTKLLPFQRLRMNASTVGRKKFRIPSIGWLLKVRRSQAPKAGEQKIANANVVT